MTEQNTCKSADIRTGAHDARILDMVRRGELVGTIARDIGHAKTRPSVVARIAYLQSGANPENGKMALRAVETMFRERKVSRNNAEDALSLEAAIDEWLRAVGVRRRV